MKVLGVIPARGGSKGVKRKNIRLINGRPLIYYTIITAKESRVLDYLIVSTDDNEIAEISENYGVRVIKRPTELATDTSPVVDSVLHALDVLHKEGRDFEIIVLLQPTSPLRTSKDIENALKILETDKNNTDCVISVSKMEDPHPARMYKINKDGFLRCLWPNFENYRRQELPPVYYRNGAIYVIKVKTLRKERTFMCEKKRAYIMSSEWIVNIDSERDLLIAEVMIKLWKKKFGDT